MSASAGNGVLRSAPRVRQEATNGFTTLATLERGRGYGVLGRTVQNSDVVLLFETPFEKHPCAELTYEFSKGGNCAAGVVSRL